MSREIRSEVYALESFPNYAFFFKGNSGLKSLFWCELLVPRKNRENVSSARVSRFPSCIAVADFQIAVAVVRMCQFAYVQRLGTTLGVHDL